MDAEIDQRRDGLIDKLAGQYKASYERMSAMEDKLREENKSLWQRVYDATVGLIKKILAFKDMLLSILMGAVSLILDIISDPIGFLGNLVSGIIQGLEKFMSNIAVHLQKGLMDWLFGAIAGTGLQLPDKFDLQGIVSIVLQILGLTYANFRARAVALVGEPVVAALEQAAEVFKIIITEGIPGLWRFIKDQVGDLKSMVLDAIFNFIKDRVIMAGITWIIGLLNPASAFFKACKAIYDIVVFFINRGSQIIALVNAVIDSIKAIVKGALGTAVLLVEGALAKAIPVAIGFLASLLGLGDPAKPVRETIEKARSPINKAIDWVINLAVKAVRAAGKLIVGLTGKKDKEEKVKETPESKEIKSKIKTELDGKQITSTEEEDTLISNTYKKYKPFGLRSIKFVSSKDGTSLEVLVSASLEDLVAKLTTKDLAKLIRIAKNMNPYSKKTTIYVSYDAGKSFGSPIKNKEGEGHAETRFKNKILPQLLNRISKERQKNKLVTPPDQPVPVTLDINRSPCDGCSTGNLLKIVEDSQKGTAPKIKLIVNVVAMTKMDWQSSEQTSIKSLIKMKQAGIEINTSKVWAAIEAKLKEFEQFEYESKMYDKGQISTFKAEASQVQVAINNAVRVINDLPADKKKGG